MHIDRYKKTCKKCLQKFYQKDMQNYKYCKKCYSERIIQQGEVKPTDGLIGLFMVYIIGGSISAYLYSLGTPFTYMAYFLSFITAITGVTTWINYEHSRRKTGYLAKVISLAVAGGYIVFMGLYFTDSFGSFGWKIIGALIFFAIIMAIFNSGSSTGKRRSSRSNDDSCDDNYSGDYESNNRPSISSSKSYRDSDGGGFTFSD